MTVAEGDDGNSSTNSSSVKKLNKFIYVKNRNRWLLWQAHCTCKWECVNVKLRRCVVNLVLLALKLI